MSASAMSSSTGSAGMPNRMTRPPLRTISNAFTIARGFPDISKTTSTCSPSFCSTNHPATSSTPVVSSAAVTPILRASSRRNCRRSVARTRVAPDARAIGMLKSPTGPQPRIATDLAETSAWLSANTALPNGSWSVAISGGSFERSFCQMTDSGTATYCAKAPSRSTPRIFVYSHMCARPVRQWKQLPHVT